MINNTLDVLIVGAGPIGIEMAAACHREKLGCLILEAGQIGNTIAWWAPQTRWFSSNDRISIAGVPLETIDQTKATREQYLTYLRTVARQFNIQIQPFCSVESVSRNSEGLLDVNFVKQTIQQSVSARNVVLAIGGTDIPNRMNIPGEDLLHVDGYFREPHRYFGRNVVIIGGRNSAVEAALRTYHAGAKSVTLVYRGCDLPRQSIKYWLLPEIDGLIKAGRIRAHFSANVTAITAQNVVIQRQQMEGEPPIEKCNTTHLPADDVLTLIGYRQDKRLWKACNIRLIGESERPDFDEDTMMTNIPGIYVAGTAVAGTQSSKYKIFLENCHTHVDRILRSILKSTDRPEADESTSVTREFLTQIEAMPET